MNWCLEFSVWDTLTKISDLLRVVFGLLWKGMARFSLSLKSEVYLMIDIFSLCFCFSFIYLLKKSTRRFIVDWFTIDCTKPGISCLIHSYPANRVPCIFSNCRNKWIQTNNVCTCVFVSLKRWFFFRHVDLFCFCNFWAHRRCWPLDRGLAWLTPPSRLGRLDFQKFCLIFALNHLILYKKRSLKKYQIFKLKTVWMQNGQFNYVKSWIFGNFGNFTI